jgi:NAD(P)-dependent dehydrogenase (short-subunit alcohol dehydrogenase family)
MEHTAIVTGAARGIGRGVADHLERAGWRVARLDVDTGRDHPLRRVRRRVGRRAFEMLGDFFRGRARASRQQRRHRRPARRPVEDMPLEVWNRYLAVNLTGPS